MKYTLSMHGLGKKTSDTVKLLSEMLKDFEILARDQKNVNKFPEYIDKFTNEINEACKELKTLQIK